jgi:hypothetical protein
METFDNSPEKYVEYDAAGNRLRGEKNFDPESQQISDEFKRPPY